MNLIPDEELKKQTPLNLAAMVDFLFLVIAVFAAGLMTKSALFDEEITLAKGSASAKKRTAQNCVVNVSISRDGSYKFITEVTEFPLGTAADLRKEIYREQQMGLLPKNKEQIQVLLHIDQEAKWSPIAEAIVTLQESGFKTHPVYTDHE